LKIYKRRPGKNPKVFDKKKLLLKKEFTKTTALKSTPKHDHHYRTFEK